MMGSRAYLLDSQVLIWLGSEKSLLGFKSRQLIERGEIYFSAVSVAELRFKSRHGKLKLANNAVDAWFGLGFKAINFNLEAAEHFWSFSAHEVPDAIDRQTMATARANHFKLITSNRRILAQGFDWVLDATT